MGITHFEDLKPTELIDALGLSWTVSEKLDGSFLGFGLDEDGHFYTARKDGTRYYDIEDWPEKGWTNPFRCAHTVLYSLLSEWKHLGRATSGDSGTVEVLNGHQPNSVHYPLANRLVITDWSGGYNQDLLDHTSAFLFSVDQFTTDGRTFTREKVISTWMVNFNFVNSQYLQKIRTNSDIHNRVVNLRMDFFQEALPDWMVKDILDVKLNKRHERISEKDWPEFKAKIKEIRPKLEAHLQTKILELKELLLNAIPSTMTATVGPTSQTEGLVVKTSRGTVFKLVDRPNFLELNRKTHIVKYWLVGGRRPARPCFMSRTADWPVEKRLARLDLLLKRYETHHEKLRWEMVMFGQSTSVSYTADLDDRVLILFADVRERINDGR